MIVSRVTADKFAPVATQVRAEVAVRLRHGVAAETTALQTELRGQINAAGLGQRLSQTWRSRVYPQSGEPTLEPAGLVWSKAGTIVTAHNEGSLIRARGHQYLAIPTEFVPRKANRRMTPREVEKRFGRELRFVPLKTGNAVYLMDQVVVGKSGGLRRATKRRRAQGRAATSKIMFTLVRQVKLRKRLDIEGAARSAERRLASRVQAAGS